MKQYKNLQEVFDAAYIGLWKQGWKPAYSLGSCRYLTNNGKRCAIGHCIPDELIDDMPFEGSISALKYKPTLITTNKQEDADWHHNGQITGDIVWLSSEHRVEQFHKVKKLFANVNVELLQALQSAHDEPAIAAGTFDLDEKPESVARKIKARFEAFASDHNLTVPTLPAI